MPTHRPCLAPFQLEEPARTAPASIVRPAISQLIKRAWKCVVTFKAPWLASIIQFRIMLDQITPQAMMVAPAITRVQAIGPCSQRISKVGGGTASDLDSGSISRGVGVQIDLPIQPPIAPNTTCNSG